jgi:hypothetical protein
MHRVLVADVDLPALDQELCRPRASARSRGWLGGVESCGDIPPLALVIVYDQRLLVAQSGYVQVEFDEERRVLAGHGVHGLPFGEAQLEVVAIFEDDVELGVLVWYKKRREGAPTHLF